VRIRVFGSQAKCRRAPSDSASVKGSAVGQRIGQIHDAPGLNLVSVAGRSGLPKCFPADVLLVKEYPAEKIVPSALPGGELYNLFEGGSSVHEVATRKAANRDDKALPPAEHRFATAPER